MEILKSVIGAMIFLMVSSAAHSATIIVENGELVGADGIEFEGYVGSVRFVEGTCADLFNGCDEPSDLVFQSFEPIEVDAQRLAVAANEALLEQVIKANPLYDENPILTFGCGNESNIAFAWCATLTPFFQRGNGFVQTINLQNQEGSRNVADSVGGGGGWSINEFDTGLTSNNQPDRYTYAAWTITAVPVPAAGPMFFAALALLGFFTRRSKSGT
jgi:hypothetical protein